MGMGMGMGMEKKKKKVILMGMGMGGKKMPLYISGRTLFDNGKITCYIIS